MSTKEQKQMKGCEATLSQPKPLLDIPLTEIVIFTLLEDLTPDTEALIASRLATPSCEGKGVHRVAYVHSLDNPCTFVLMIDWCRIQDHFDFWQTDDFLSL
jgi:hypothetical protein